MRSKQLISYLLLLVGLHFPLLAQQDPSTQMGNTNYMNFDYGDIDQVNLQNGNLFIKIPLLSFPQVGNKLRLNFIVRYNHPQWSVSLSNDPSLVGEGYYVGQWTVSNDADTPAIGVDVVRDQFLSNRSLDQTFLCYTPYCEGEENIVTAQMQDPTSTDVVKLYQVRTPDGGMHPYAMHSTNIGNAGTIQTTPDGTGITPLSRADGWGANNFIGPDGVKYTGIPSLDPSNTSDFQPPAYNVSDPSGNQITVTSSGWTDTVGRVIPGTFTGPGGGGEAYPSSRTGYSQATYSQRLAEDDLLPGVETSDYTGCTGDVTDARVWTVPGPSSFNGGVVTYRLCYEDVAYQSNFNVTSIQGYGAEILEASGYKRLLHQIVLPDGSSYAFDYDAYLDLTQITLPTGATVAYQWDSKAMSVDSVIAPRSRVVVSRTVTPISSPVGRWTYQYFPNDDSVHANPTVVLLRTIVTDPAGMDQDLAQTNGTPDTVLTHYSGRSPNNPTSQSPLGIALETISTTHLGLQTPFGGDNNGDPLSGPPASVVTQFAGGAATETDYTYVPATTAVGLDYRSYGTSTDNYSSYNCQCLFYGSLRSTSVYDFASSTRGDLLRSTATTYQWEQNPSYLTANLLALPASVQTRQQHWAAQTDFGYDDNSNGSPNGAFGNRTSVSRWTGQEISSVLVNQTVYNAKGIPITIIDGNGNVTQENGSQCNGLSPQSVTQAFGTPIAETSSTTVDCNTGQVIGQVDVNGIAASFEFNDSLGRPTKIKSAVNTPSESWVSIAYPSLTQISIGRDLNTKGDGALQSSSTKDGMGRTITTVGPSGSKLVTTYDSLGRVASISNPYLSMADSTYGITQFSYDALDRKVRQQQPDGISSLWWCFNGIQTANQPNCNANHSQYQLGEWVDSSDEAGNDRQSVSDALGELRAVYEANGAETDYTYTVLGDLNSVQQNGKAGEASRIRIFNYDALSRLITSFNPESGTICYGQIASGVCQSGYDLNGNLLYMTDARGVTKTYSYDALNRVHSKSFSDGTQIAVFGYDGNNENGTPLHNFGIPSSNAVGKLSMFSNQSSIGTAFSYDSIGRLKVQTQTFSSTNRWDTTTAASYDLAGNMTDLLYPDGSTVTQHFDSAGRLDSVKAGTTQNPGSPYVTSISYLPSGTPGTVVYGNGVSETLTQNSRLQTCENVVANGGSTYIHRQYFYSPNNQSGQQCTSVANDNGNIFSIGDTLNSSHLQVFGYDSLNRIRTWDAPSFAGSLRHQQFDYDSFGNLNQTNGYPVSGAPDPLTSPAAYNTSQWPYDSSNHLLPSYFNCLPLGVSGTLGQVSGYDAAGNTLCSGTQNSDAKAFVWDAENRVSQLWQQQNNNTYFMQSRYFYGADGGRVRAEQVALNSQTSAYDVQSYREYVSFNGQVIAEKDQTNAWTNYIFANGKKIASLLPKESVISVSADAGSGGNWLWYSTNQQYAYPIQQGDKLSWRQYQTGGAQGGILIGLLTGANSAWTTYDQNGMLTNSSTNHDYWENRTMDLSSFAQAGIYTIAVGMDNTSTGLSNIQVADLAITSLDGEIHSIFNGQPIGLGVISTNNGMANAQGGVVSIPTSTSAIHYYAGDHLGTAQMEFSSGGWPVWKGEFAPFGQELDTQATANRYKFTGKERDAESGLDYFGARYYASGAGRFMTPDPVLVSPELENPQSWNKYSYSFNRPTAFTDPDGRWPGWYHTELDLNFFGNQLHMSKHDQQVIVEQSAEQDAFGILSFRNGQSTDNVRWHGMDDFWNQVGAAQAIANTESYISQSINEAVYWQLRADSEGGYCSSCHDASLRSLADAEHAGQDLSSPEHRGKPWTAWGGIQHWRAERHSAMSADVSDEIARSEAIYDTQLIYNRFQNQLTSARKKTTATPNWDCMVVTATCQ